MENPYLTACWQAVGDDQEFNRFKRNPDYVDVVQTVNYWTGRLYLREIERDYPDLIERMDRFRVLDSLGGPEVFFYGRHGEMSPTLLRYIKVLGDIQKLFGSLDGMRIVEIGCGYGGQCVLLKQLFDIKSYTLVDLPPVLQLTEKCLQKIGLGDRVSCRVMEELSGDDRYDLFISNYAFTELPPDIQDTYWEKTVQTTPRGYLTYNYNPVSHSREVLLGRVKNPRIFNERPQTVDGNCIIAWGTDGEIPVKPSPGEKLLDSHEQARSVILGAMGFVPATREKVARRDRVKAFAVKGNPEAMFDLGVMNYFGQFPGGNFPAATKWFQQAMERGSLDAEKFLGLMHFLGDGIPQDLERAMACFRKVAGAGDVFIQRLLGKLLLKGEAGVVRNEGEGRYWLDQSRGPCVKEELVLN